MNVAAPIGFKDIPTAVGLITLLAYAQARTAGVRLESLFKVSGITQSQVEDPRLRVRVRDQIRFLNLVADAVKDEFLGFHLAQLPDLR